MCRHHCLETVVKEGGHLRNKYSYSSPQRLNCHLQTYVVLNTVFVCKISLFDGLLYFPNNLLY